MTVFLNDLNKNSYSDLKKNDYYLPCKYKGHFLFLSDFLCSSESSSDNTTLEFSL